MDARSEDSSGQRRTTELGGCTLRELLLQSAAAKLRHWAATLRKSPTTAATATESSTTNPITNTSTSLPSLRRKKPRAPSKRLRPKVVPGEAELLQWIAETDYEINVDPYRGIQSLLMEQQQQQAAATALREGPAVEDLTFDDDEEVEISQRLAAGPWRSRCSFGFGCTSTNCTTATAANVPMAAQSAPPSEHDSEESAVVVELPPPPQQQIVQKVRATCQSTCPTLIQWTMLAVQEQFKTQKQQQQKKKKRPRAAEKNCGSDDDDDQPQTHVWGRRRFANPRQRCACDYNPFCLGTLGGAMDEILHEWSSSPSRRPPEQVNNDDDVVEVAPSDGYGNAECHSIVDSVTQSWDDLSCPFYSFQTLEMLRAVRKFKMIDETVVRSYLQTVLQNLTAAMSLDEGVHRVRQLHQSLIFRNPLLDDDDERTREYTVSEKGQKGRNLPLSLPPGIENLGATCYLNTQLQCLAQNRVFVQGIMSWRASKGAGVDDRMSSVLSLFQDLLVRMNAGPRSTLNTIEFSNTLGLDHYEQQDPNEFSRLLFEKMHESFQKEKTSQGGNLAELLPHLFQGVMMYETTCLTCKAKSSRTEEFMDLNLPIVHPKLPKKPGQQSILDTFAAQLDTDVQTCLGMYCHPETLDGDNQYLCSQCGGKRDAKRELTFQTLPPVLNIQLSRYVFDREKLMKKKLSDKVLLPLDLRVKALSKQLNLGSVEHRYVLCAVMRHKGISAHSGHYVAEAMDWLTGQWFEFNDEKVVLLDDGPSCSYDPTALDDKEQVPMAVGVQRRKATGLAGSQDAYNMYYVEETFLAQSALDGLRRGSDAEVSGESASVVEKIAVERSEFYADLSQ